MDLDLAHVRVVVGAEGGVLGDEILTIPKATWQDVVHDPPSRSRKQGYP